MRLAPTYGTAAPLTIDGEHDDQAETVTRQRRRFQALLASFDDAQWEAPSRCDGWSTKDVAAHLVSVNAFWEASVRAGLQGAPTEVLANFDPAAHPPLLIEPLRGLPPGEVLEQFVRSNDGFLDALASLRGEQWELLAESPAGHVSMRLLAHHALWDCWVHERDVAVPLGVTPVAEPDEVSACLRYAAAIGPFLARTWPESDRVTGVFAVDASAPRCTFTVEIAGAITVTSSPPPQAVPCLRGDATVLVDALSVRSPLPQQAPPEWRALVRNLATVFDQ